MFSLLFLLGIIVFIIGLVLPTLSPEGDGLNSSKGIFLAAGALMMIFSFVFHFLL